MSIARVTTVDRARKDQGKCGKCGTALPKGSAYRWFTVGFRSNYKQVRCMRYDCSPKQSELESSLLANIYAAQENAEEAINSSAPGDYDAIRDAFTEVNDAIQEVAQQYRDQDEAFGGYGSTPAAERADALESAEVEDNLYDEDFEDWCDEHQDEREWEQAQDEKPEDERLGLDEAREQCEDCQSRMAEWWSDITNAAVEAVTSVDLG